MAENKIQMPGAFGGLMRYDSEYKSRFMLSPGQVISFIVAIIIIVLALKFLFPISSISGPTGISSPIPSHKLILSLLK